MKILIVDDQERILEATRRLVNWDKLQVDEVFTANSAAAAKKILAKEAIDIMLTDIEMPGENGIELQKWQSENYPDVACIFLTSHADFTYAQEAIRNGAFGYILQPASFPEIEETVGKCIAQLKERNLLIRKSSQYDAKREEILEQHVFTMFNQKSQFANMEGWRVDSSTTDEKWWYLPCLMEIWGADSAKVKEKLDQTMAMRPDSAEKVYSVSCCLDDGHIGNLIYGSGITPERVNMKEKMYFVVQEISEGLGCKLNLYAGEHAKDDLPEQIEQIFNFYSGRILNRNEVYLVERAKAAELRKPDGAVWGRWLIRRDISLVRNQITNMLRYAQVENHLTISYMQQIIHAFLEALSVACYEQSRNLSELFTDSFRYEQMLHAYSSVEELCEGMDFCLRQYEAMLPEKEGEEATGSVQERIQEILHYLDENMDQMISRRDAAKYVFLNEDYFSRMFRKETGLNYKEYVLKHKMDYAGKLLEDTDLPVTLIASKVGYDNFTNFSKMFRKVMGMTPTDHRKKAQEMSKSEKR